jgi:hypothetical protein
MSAAAKIRRPPGMSWFGSIIVCLDNGLKDLPNTEMRLMLLTALSWHIERQAAEIRENEPQ